MIMLMLMMMMVLPMVFPTKTYENPVLGSLCWHRHQPLGSKVFVLTAWNEGWLGALGCTLALYQLYIYSSKIEHHETVS
jgi:hypothetical protein